MTPAEYVQLKAFARQDGAVLALLWIASFATYIIGLSEPVYSIMALSLVVVTPFFVASRLRNYRDYGREGVITFRRGWGFVVFVFFYASLLFAVAQYTYFAFLDHGFFLESMYKLVSSSETEQLMVQSGMVDAMNDSLNELQSMSPIDLSLNILTTNILLGMLIGLPIAAVMRRNSVADGRHP